MKSFQIKKSGTGMTKDMTWPIAASVVAALAIMMLHNFSTCFSPLAAWEWEDLCLDTVDSTELELDTTLSVVIEVEVVVTVVSSARANSKHY